MENRSKYLPSKKQLTLADLKTRVAEANKALKRANAALDEATKALKFARDLLKDKEEENRQLKLIILRMTEQGERKDD